MKRGSQEEGKQKDERPFPLTKIRSAVYDRTSIAITDITAKAHGKSAVREEGDEARGVPHSIVDRR
jgi:hypothetical protein